MYNHIGVMGRLVSDPELKNSFAAISARVHWSWWKDSCKAEPIRQRTAVTVIL